MNLIYRGVKIQSLSGPELCNSMDYPFHIAHADFRAALGVPVDYRIIVQPGILGPFGGFVAMLVYNGRSLSCERVMSLYHIQSFSFSRCV